MTPGAREEGRGEEELLALCTSCGEDEMCMPLLHVPCRCLHCACCVACKLVSLFDELGLLWASFRSRALVTAFVTASATVDATSATTSAAAAWLRPRPGPRSPWTRSHPRPRPPWTRPVLVATSATPLDGVDTTSVIPSAAVDAGHLSGDQTASLRMPSGKLQHALRHAQMTAYKFLLTHIVPANVSPSP